MVGMCLLSASILALYWGVRPSSLQTHSIDLLQAELQLPESQMANADPRAYAGKITLVWPIRIRLDDPAEVRLRFEATLAAEPPTPEQYSSFLQSRLEMIGLQHTPTGEISQAFSLDHPVVFLWNLRPLQTGLYQGKAWIRLRQVETNTGAEKNHLLAAPSFDIQVESLLGVSGRQARLLGSLGVIIGVVLSLDGILKRIGKLIGGLPVRRSKT